MAGNVFVCYSISIIIIRHQFIALTLHSALCGGCRDKKLTPTIDIAIVNLTWLLIGPDHGSY